MRNIIENEKNQCYTSSLSVAEVIIKLKKIELDYEAAFDVIRKLSTILNVDESVSFEAGVLYVEKRKALRDIGIVDVIIMARARREKLTIITGDREHFKDERNIILL